MFLPQDPLKTDLRKFFNENLVLSIKSQCDFDTCKYRTLFSLNFVKHHQPYFLSNFNLAIGKGRIGVY